MKGAFKYPGNLIDFIPESDPKVKVSFMPTPPKAKRKTAAAKRAKATPTARPAYVPPQGWRVVQTISLPLETVAASSAVYTDSAGGAVIRKAFVKIWGDYTKSLKSKPVHELCVAVHPRWLAAALGSPELTAQQTRTNDGLRLYGLRVREEKTVGVNEVVVEERE